MGWNVLEILQESLLSFEIIININFLKKKLITEIDVKICYIDEVSKIFIIIN